MDLQKWSFQWQGRSKQGVHKWAGNPKGPPRSMGLAFQWYGALAGVGGVVGLVLRLCGVHSEGLSALMGLGLSHGVIFSLIGALMLRQHRSIARLTPAEEVCAALGVEDAQALDRLAEEKGVRPRLIVNDRPLYNLADFSGAQILLRGSSAPVPPETLLRPASGHADDTPAAELLRATDAAGGAAGNAAARDESNAVAGDQAAESQPLRRG